jgi:Holliday junction resolvasome RuvABC endonuclease subunit
MNPGPMYVIGVDPGLVRTGIGIIDLLGDACRARTFVVVTSSVKNSYPADDYWQIAAVVDGVTAVTPSYPGELGLVEQPAYDAEYGKHTERDAVYYGIVGVLARRKTPVAKIAPKTLKRWCVGRGGSAADPVEKRDVVAAMRGMWPGVSATHSELRHHECEGLAMAQMCAQRLGWPVPVLTHHRAPRGVVRWPPPHPPRKHS